MEKENNNAWQIGQTKLATLIWGEQLIKKFQNNEDEKQGKKKKIRPVRKIWEIGNAQSQCQSLQKDKKIKEIYGEPILPQIDNCWICGFSLKVTKTTPECEHILPIAQACIFLKLYSSKLRDSLIQGNTPYNKYIINVLRHEYDYAHPYCNQIKSDLSFIRYDPTQGRNIVDRNKIINYLNSLTTSVREDGKDVRPLINNALRSGWLETQTDIMVLRYTKILEFIYESREPGISNLILLAGTINAMDENTIETEFTKLLTDVNVQNFIYHLKLDLYTITQNSDAIALQLAKSIFYKFGTPYWLDNFLNKVETDFSYINIEPLPEIEANSANAANILIGLKPEPPMEEFMESNNEATNGEATNGENVNMNTTIHININSEKLQKLNKATKYFADKLYENIYNKFFIERREQYIPDVAEPIAIEIITLYFYKYIRNWILYDASIQRLRIPNETSEKLKNLINRLSTLIFRERGLLDELKDIVCADFRKAPFSQPPLWRKNLYNPDLDYIDKLCLPRRSGGRYTRSHLRTNKSNKLKKTRRRQRS
jgi:hypothetical protein